MMADPRDFTEFTSERPTAPKLSVIPNRKPVGLVTNALQEMKCSITAIEMNWLALPRQEDLFLLFC